MYAKSFVASPRSRCLLGLLLVAVIGCSSGSGSTLTGKVTLNDQAVAGSVILVGPDKKEHTVPISPDGVYSVGGLAPGEYAVRLKGNGPKPPPPPKDVPLPKDAVDKSGPTLQPPAKYTQGNTGLKVTVSGGAQTYDIPLTP